MINCGGALDLTSLFGLAEDPDLDMMLFLLDSHRPINLANIYDDDHVLVFELDEIQHPHREVFEGMTEDDPEVVSQRSQTKKRACVSPFLLPFLSASLLSKFIDFTSLTSLFQRSLEI